MLKINKNSNNCGGTSKNQKDVASVIENKVEELLDKKAQEEREKSVTDDQLRTYIMFVI